jgi:hypothetical protein
MKKDIWPELPYEQAKDTYETIHMWTQIVGKIKLAKLPWLNHSWHVTLKVSPYGLTTGDIPGGEKHFQINFNFLHHQLEIYTSTNEEQSFDLTSLSVSSCYHALLNTLKNWGINVQINPIPNEIADAIPFYENDRVKYDRKSAENYHQALLKVNEVFTRFRAEFTGKASPVHFFWGSFDLAVSRFSGREAPVHPGGIPNLPDRVVREAYSREVSSAGFWPGDPSNPFAAFYSYVYPEPEGFKDAAVKPEVAYYNDTLREFILPYKEVREADSPREMLMAFLHSTYNAAANLAQWDRNHLEKESLIGAGVNVS